MLSGPVRGMLTAERTALNFLQRLSGVATLTRRYVEKIQGTGAAILDTRKTTPGLRLLEKYAVRMGGGRNHRLGLYDMIMIKDTHWNLIGNLEEAVARCRGKAPGICIEVEAACMAQVLAAVQAGADWIMLDNMAIGQMKEAVAVIRQQCRGSKRIRIEASGGVTLANVREVAETGVDFISVGALTHSAPALDIAFYLRS
jgi:nicotinate-nucleotide pyrophosphorylase (carboxylating)